MWINMLIRILDRVRPDWKTILFNFTKIDENRIGSKIK